MTSIIFGKKEPHQLYQDRFAAYIIVKAKDADQIAIVKAPNGAYFLPGGEIEGVETKEEAIHREMMEELGMTVVIASYIGEAADYFYSRHRDTHYHNPGYFFTAADWEKVSAPTEAGSVYEWVTPAVAIAKLKRGSHKWAVESWLKNR